MTSSNRATKYESLYKSLKKHLKPAPDTPDRSVLDHLLYACCLEDAKYEQADEAFAKLQQAYFDWNEVRVTTAVELGEALQTLPYAAQAAARIKQCLQALFESRYQYEIDDLKKANLGKAIAELEAWKGITPFIVSYVSQHALGGHSIPISRLILDALLQCEAITQAEAEKHTVPGLERSIPKNKGVEFASLLHQFALELHLHPKSTVGLAVLKDLGVTYKPKPKVEPKTAQRPIASKVDTTRPTTAHSKPTEAPVSGTAKGASKTESNLASAAHSKPVNAPSGKKADIKKAATELVKPQKHVDTKSAETKIEAKPTTVKKMVAPPATTKETSADKKTPPDKKNVPARPTTKPTDAKNTKKKIEPGKGHRDETKNKQSLKPKPPASKAKPDVKSNTKKGTPSGKSTGSSSVASSITKKKPK